MYYIDFLASAMIVVESNLPKEPSFFLRLLDRLAWLLKKKTMVSCSNPTEDYDLINLVISFKESVGVSVKLLLKST